MKEGDYLICKKNYHKYRIQIIYNYPIAWGGTTGSFTRQLPDEFKIYYIKEYLINDILFKEDILTCFFYSKNEERENKLKKLNERRRLFNL